MGPGEERPQQRPEGDRVAPERDYVAPKRDYVAPKLERLGTIRDLTHGAGQKSNFDNTHPPGQNKSII
jgi:hypothetical protein